MAKSPKTPLGKDIAEFVTAVEQAVEAGKGIKAQLDKFQKGKEPQRDE